VHRVGEGGKRWALACGWAAAEATVWPLMPEAVLVPMVVARPADWWWLALASVAGSSIGGAASYAVGRRPGSGATVAQLWLVRPAMVAAADAWLVDEGPTGVRHQPLSGLPFKVFARVAGARGLPPLAFLAWAAVARGARFLAVCAAAGLAGHRFGRLVRQRRLLLLGLWALVFTAGLARTVRAWGQGGQEKVRPLQTLSRTAI